ncbi:hypothetical protein CXR04_23890 [Streptomyces sp. CMB-StM0423]|nr:hypothetical protein CXR04_23890 [Streptomyces sp. CMB-StM0423]
MKRRSGRRTGNRYDDPMVVHDVTRKPPGRQVLLVARLHVDLCRLASAACTTAPPRAAGRAWGHRPRA